MDRRKKTVAVFFGGCSAEYEVSLESAYSVIKSIDKEKYDLVLVGIDRESGQWFLYNGEPERIKEDRWQSDGNCTLAFPNVDRNLHGLCYVEGTGLRTVSVDAALPILHGRNGEDGTVQGILELMDVPVIGCDLLSSGLCMDKEFAHRIVRMSGVKAAEAVLLEKNDSWETIQKKAAGLRYPLFVKPVRAGSSFGITKIAGKEELSIAVEKAFQYDSSVMLEEEVKGFEVGCAVIGVNELFVGEVDEIELTEGFFDYTEKYTLKTSAIHVPARISVEKAAEIKETALTIYKALKCSYFARVDMFLTPEGEIYFNEVNTIPGFTSHSRFPNMLRAAGMTFEEVTARLLGACFGEERGESV